METQELITNELFFKHHQVKDAHWGEMHGPPYPLSKTVSTGKTIKKGAKLKSVNESKLAASRKGISGMLADAKAKKEAAKKQAARVEALKKARDAKNQKEKEAKEREELKQKVIKSRSASMLYKHADLFTTEELQTYKNRLSVETELKNMSPDLIDKGKKFIKTASTVSDALEKTANAMNNGIKNYNNVVRVLNSFTDSDLPYIKGIPQDVQNPQQSKKKKNKNKNKNDN